MSSGDSSDTYVTVVDLTKGVLTPVYFEKLLESYEREFDAKPRFVVRVPGRVNIIGEHVDYCGYPVLPMAIDQCITLAVGYNENDSFLQLRNLEAEKFENFKCDLNSIDVDELQRGGPKWYKYFLCGVKGILETLDSNCRPMGMTVVVGGNIPPAAGLSSSSALVSAATLAVAQAHRLPLERRRLASISANCERYIGTQGGGMDQAIAYLAKAGCAQFIEFHPSLTATPIQLPAGACFVVANSLAEKNKAASSDFNERVVECRLGARILAKEMQLSDWRDVTRFQQLQEALECTLAELERLATKLLPQDCYTREQICQRLAVTPQELEAEFLTSNTRHMTTFKLRQRSLHVIQESLRVCQFRSICEQNESTEHSGGKNGLNGDSSFNGTAYNNSDKLSTLAQLMRESHRSLKDLYECSHEDLDRIIDISDTLGVGARLTGAGWGGCVVALCDSARASDEFVRVLKEQYFARLPTHTRERHQHNNFADVVFSTCPRNGAEIYKLH